MREEAIKQNTPGLYDDIQLVGCFFRAAAHMAEYIASATEKRKKLLTITDINNLWAAAKNNGLIDGNNDVKDSAAIANLALNILHVKGKFTEVATFKNGKMGWYNSIPTDKRRADFYIQKIEQNGPSKTHFVNVDKYGTLCWDPHQPQITKVRTVHTICYRYDGEQQPEADFVERMKEELDDLRNKIRKLETFKNSPKYKNVKPYKKDLMRMQLNAMDFYALMLQRRIEAEAE